MATLLTAVIESLVRYLEKFADAKTIWCAVAFFAALLIFLPESWLDQLEWSAFADAHRGLIWFAFLLSLFLLAFHFTPKVFRYLRSRPPAPNTQDISLEEMLVLYAYMKTQFQPARLRSDHPVVVSLVRRHFIEQPIEHAYVICASDFETFRPTKRGEKLIRSPRFFESIQSSLSDDAYVLNCVNTIFERRLIPLESNNAYLPKRPLGRI